MEKILSENLSPIEQDKRRTWQQLDTVGPSKPVGYFPVETIESYVGKKLEEVMAYLQNKGLEVKIFTGSEWPGFHGALYIYDKAVLQRLLDENRQILLEARWPTSADDFVANLKRQEKIGTPIFKIIAKAFGDKFSEGLESEE